MINALLIHSTIPFFIRINKIKEKQGAPYMGELMGKLNHSK